MQDLRREKSRRARGEAIEQLYHKPLNSTMFERLQVLEQADKQVQGLPQPLQLGEGLLYVAATVSLPVKEWDILIGRIPEVVPDEEQEAYIGAWGSRYPQGNRPGWLADGGHTTFAWEHLLHKGLGGLRDEVAAFKEEREAADADETVLVFLQGKLLIFDAYATYIRRYAQAAERAGLPHQAEVCRRVSAQPPQTFEEALQLLLLVGQFFSVYCLTVAALSYGRIDELLLPLYLADVESGRLTPETAGLLIADFNNKYNLILGRGEHQMGTAESVTGWLRNPFFDNPQYILLGGYIHEGEYRENPLTRLFLEQCDPQLKNMVHIFRRTAQDDPELWRLVCDKLRQNASVLVYNDETEIPAMKSAGITAGDAVNYSIHACNWPDVAGNYAAIRGIDADMVGRILKEVLREDARPDSIDDLYRAVTQGYRRDLRALFDDLRDFLGQDVPPTLLTTAECFMNDTARRTRAMMHGGIRYPLVYIQLLHIATAADMMTALDDLVFTRRVCTLPEMRRALEDNFEGHEALRRECLRAPKYGDDDALSRRHAVRLMNAFLDIAQEESRRGGVQDIYYLHMTISDMWYVGKGAVLPASPDGRRKGEPLSENLSPMPGVTSGEVTTLLRAVSRLPFDRIHAGAFNLRVRSDWVTGEEGLDRLTALLKTYFDMGGMQVQVSLANTDELRAAQQDPERYRDLLVRITGYSAVFVDMSRNAQEQIIRRDELR